MKYTLLEALTIMTTAMKIDPHTITAVKNEDGDGSKIWADIDDRECYINLDEQTIQYF